MHSKNCLLYSLLLLFVVVSGIAATEPPPFITYTCDNSKKVTNVSITDSIAKHVRVLKKDGDYCHQTSANKDGILQCIKDFNKPGSGAAKIQTVTLIYEDEVEDAIVGGINTKYFTLSCDAKAGNVTAVIAPMNVKPTRKTHPSTLNAVLNKRPTMKILNHPNQIYVGEKLKLEMTVDSAYKLLPQNCMAYRTEQDTHPYLFWKRCSFQDVSIISTNTWTSTSGLSTLTVDMYAFRFIETETLIIKCYTTVCPDTDTQTCEKKCVKRKRRSKDNTIGKTNSNDATVSLALHVFDRRQFQENGSKGISPIWYIYTIGFGMIYWITWKKL